MLFWLRSKFDCVWVRIRTAVRLLSTPALWAQRRLIADGSLSPVCIFIHLGSWWHTPNTHTQTPVTINVFIRIKTGYISIFPYGTYDYCRPGVLNRRATVRIWTQTQSNLDRSQSQHSNLIMIQASFHWCVISRYIFFSYSMWFLSSVSNPEVQSGAVI